MERVKLSISKHPLFVHFLSNYCNWNQRDYNQSTCTIAKWFGKALCGALALAIFGGLALGGVVDSVMWGIFSIMAGEGLEPSVYALIGTVINVLAVLGVLVYMLNYFGGWIYDRNEKRKEALEVKRQQLRRLPLDKIPEKSALRKIYEAAREKICIPLDIVD